MWLLFQSMMRMILLVTQLLVVPADWTTPALFVAMMTMMLMMMMMVLPLDSPSSPPQTSTQFHRLMQQVEELVSVMRSNVSVLKKKGTRIKSLRGKMDKLSKISRAFKVRAKGFHNSIWWKHNRMKTIVQLEIGILFAIISVTLATHTGGSSNGNKTTSTSANDLNGTATQHHQQLVVGTREGLHDQTSAGDKIQESLADQNMVRERSRGIGQGRFP